MHDSFQEEEERWLSMQILLLLFRSTIAAVYLAQNGSLKY